MTGSMLHFPQLERRVKALAGETIYQSARRGGVRIVGACGGRGTCGSCVVRVVDGQPHADDQDARSCDHAAPRKWVRACQVQPAGDATIEIAPRSLAPVARTETDTGQEAERLALAPAVTCQVLEVPEPTLAHPASDADRVRRALADPHAAFDLEALRGLPAALRAGNAAVELRRSGHEIIQSTVPGRPALGLAVDLGTTNAAGFLVDLRTGTRRAGLGIENPQVAWGADVVSRLNHAARSQQHADELREAAVTAVNALAHELSRAVGASCADIVDLVIAGNTAMHHLLLGLPVRQLGRAPFVSASREALDLKARELGIAVAPGAGVHVLPGVGGFIGGDHVAALLATEALWQAHGTSVVMDIGTNTEISLLHRGVIHSASSPSGPALEGGHIGCGMRAADGAIERVALDDTGRLVVRTIGEEPPVGVCGSGVLDALAALHRGGMVDARGRIVAGHAGTVLHAGQRAAELAPGVLFTQADVRAVQLAKAAIRTALDLLLAEAGVVHDAIDCFVIAGSFGAYIDLASAVAIGLLPDLPPARFHQVGNAAGRGVRMALASVHERRRAAELADRCRPLELSSRKDFQPAFLANLGLPPLPSPIAMETAS